MDLIDPTQKETLTETISKTISEAENHLLLSLKSKTLEIDGNAIVNLKIHKNISQAMYYGVGREFLNLMVGGSTPVPVIQYLVTISMYGTAVISEKME